MITKNRELIHVDTFFITSQNERRANHHSSYFAMSEDMSNILMVWQYKAHKENTQGKLCPLINYYILDTVRMSEKLRCWIIYLRIISDRHCSSS